jgi:alpha-D-ribose 1-methylphosphonate 5-triphosphate synthase subunit PhnG
MMDYSGIVAGASPAAVRAIAEAVLNQSQVNILKPPSPAMVMVRHTDPLENTLFLLGEAYVIECEVEVDGRLGYGRVLGSGEERALCGALVDAIMGGGHPLHDRIEALLAAEARRLDAREQAESRAVAATRVDFDAR